MRHILKYLAIALALVLSALCIASQIPAVQTMAVRKVIGQIQSQLNGRIELGEVFFRPFNTLIITDAAIIDSHPYREDSYDTLARIGLVSVKFSPLGILPITHEDIRITRVRLSDARLNFVLEDGGYRNNMTRIFAGGKSFRRTASADRDILMIKDIFVDNFEFGMKNYRSERRELPSHRINWKDLLLTNVHFRARNFSIGHGLFKGEVEKMSFHEKSGWDVKRLSASTCTGRGRTDISNILIDDGLTTLDLDYNMVGTSDRYSEYCNGVKMEIDIRKGRCALKTLAHFIPGLNPDPDTFIAIEGRCDGPVNHLVARGLHVKAEKGVFETTVNGTVKNAADYRNMGFDVSLDHTAFNAGDVCALVNSIAPEARMESGNIGKSVSYAGKISATGPINALHAEADLAQGTDKGRFCLSAGVKNVIAKNEPTRIACSLATSRLDLGPLAGIDGVSDLTLSTGITAVIPTDEQPVDVRSDSLTVKTICWKGRNFRDIKGTLTLQGSDLTVDISSRDENLNADITVWSDKYAYNGSFSVHKADLEQLDLSKNGRCDVSFNLYGHLDKDLHFLQGNANLSDISFTDSYGTHTMNNLAVEASNDDGIYHIDVDGELARGSIEGTLTTDFKADLEFGTTSELLQTVMPGLYMEKGTRAKASLSGDGFLSASLQSGRIALGKNYLRGLDISMDGPLDSVVATIRVDTVKAAGFNFDNAVAEIMASRLDSLEASLAFNSRKGHFSHGNLNASMRRTGPERTMDIRIGESSFRLDGTDWTIAESGITINGKDVAVNNVSMRSADQWISADGSVSGTCEDILTASIHNLDLAGLNAFLPDALDLKGRLNAGFQLFSPALEGEMPGMEINVTADNLTAGGQELGRIEGAAHYDYSLESFIANLKHSSPTETPLSANAAINFKDRTLDAQVTADRFPFGFLRAFVPNTFSRLGGSMSGNVTVSGPFDNLSINGKSARIDDGLLELAYTRVPYNVNGTFHLDDSGIHFDTMTATDPFGHVSPANGGIRWKNLKETSLNLHFDVNDALVLDIPSTTDEVFYGRIFANGIADITGPFGEIMLNADARTAGDSDLHIVLGRRQNATRGNLLTFTNPDARPIDPYRNILERYGKRQEDKGGGFSMVLHATASPTLHTWLDMGVTGFAAGVNGRGSGAIDLDIRPSAPLNILGDYTLQEGSFGVNVNNIARRDFSIRNGSSIKFGGDPMQSTLDIDATYETKASIATLIADTSSVASRRAVLCGIRITDRISNPQMKFSIDIPDLDPSVKSMVESALSTEDKVQRQFLSLLLSNNFMLDEQSGIVNSSSLLYSNVSEIMANQVNNIFGRLDIPLDLGLNYQPTDTGTDIFDVALSTQLWNNRVVIGGTFGNRLSRNNGTQSFFGDFDMQFKVNRSGALRLKAFSHSADQYSNYLDNSQRNGLGITWQQEYNNFSDWIVNLFSSKKKREENASREAGQSRNIQTITID